MGLLFYDKTLEDAQITFRYSLRLAEGYPAGYWNRTGPPVEGFTTFLWANLLSIAGSDLETIVHFSKILGVISYLGIIVIFLIASHSLEKNRTQVSQIFGVENGAASRAFLFSAFALSINLPFSWYSTSGMETTLFSFLIVAAIITPILSPNRIIFIFFNISLIITRPEGILISIVAATYYYQVTKKFSFLVSIFVFLVVCACLFYFRYSYFGYILPNSYYAKSGGAGLWHINVGLDYFSSYFKSYWYLVTPILITMFAMVSGRRPKNTLIITLTVSFLLYFALIAKSGGDNISAFPFWRHPLHVLPLILFITFFGTQIVAPRRARSISVLIIILTFISPIWFTIPSTQSHIMRADISLALRNFPNVRNSYDNIEFFNWMKERFNQDTVIATTLAGALPLHVDAIHIDILGLNDEIIAHSGTFQIPGATDSKTNMDSVIERRPDLIEGYMSASSILNSEDLEKTILVSRAKMNLELLSNQYFRDNYLIVSNAPYTEFNRVLFIRADYFRKIPSDSLVQTVSLEPLKKVYFEIVLSGICAKILPANKCTPR